jgi:hypothetical protein
MAHPARGPVGRRPRRPCVDAATPSALGFVDSGGPRHARPRKVAERTGTGLPGGAIPTVGRGSPLIDKQAMPAPEWDRSCSHKAAAPGQA